MHHVHTKLIFRYTIFLAIVVIVALLGWMDDERTFTIAEGMSAIALVAIVPAVFFVAFRHHKLH